jgi:hypothetical protein
MNIHFVKSPIVLAVPTWRICARGFVRKSRIIFDLSRALDIHFVNIL